MPSKRHHLPPLFVGCSVESLDLAYAIQENLEDDAEVTVWDQGIFELNKTNVESLFKSLRQSEFAIFVLSPDDALRLRNVRYSATRDNVIFELGLFMGVLGRDRVFTVIPKGVKDLRIPTDLAGLTVGTFRADRHDGNLKAALGPFCNKVRTQIRRRTKKTLSNAQRSGRQANRLEISRRRVSKPRVPLVRARQRSAPRKELVILSAVYGIREHRFNVTNELNGLVKDGRLHAYVGNQLAGDPAPNTHKNLIVRYRVGHIAKTATVFEGDDLKLP